MVAMWAIIHTAWTSTLFLWVAGTVQTVPSIGRLSRQSNGLGPIRTMLQTVALGLLNEGVPGSRIKHSRLIGPVYGSLSGTT